MTLNEKLQNKARELSVLLGIGYDTVLVILCDGSELALKHVQNNVFCDITKGEN